MEHSIKRRRVSRGAGGSAGIHRYMGEGPVSNDKKGSELHGPLLESRSSGASHSPKLFSEDIGRSPKVLAVEESKLSNLHPRNLIPNQPKEAVKSPSQTVVASVVQVVVNNGAGSKVTQLLVPVSSKVVSVQGYAPITLRKAPAAASAAPSVAANPKNSYHQQPSATYAAAPNSHAADTTVVATSPTESPPESQPTVGGAYGNSNPLSISVPGSKSQVVLSSPPSTPLPSSPAPTTSSSPTGSYFSSSAPASSAPSRPAPSTPAPNTRPAPSTPAPNTRPAPSTPASSTSAPSTSAPSTSAGTSAPSTSAPSAAASSPAQTSTTTQTSNGHNFPAPSKSNSTSTTTSFTHSGAKTTPIGPSIVTPVFSSLNSNSTLITSIKSRSTSTSSASLTSTRASSRTSNSLVASTAGSSTASRTTFSSLAASSTQLSSSSPSSFASSTGGAAGGVGGPSSTGSAPSSTASSGAGSGGQNSTNTPAVVGGVVGGVAGLAVILVVLLFLLRWRRAKSQRRTISPPIPQSLPPGVASTAPTTERSSVVPFAAGGFFRRMRPGSGQTAETTETAPSERGFQNFGGRKLESVLSSRGDGYSDPVPSSGVAPRGYAGTAAGLGLAAGVASPASHRPGLSPGPSDNETLSGSSFYRDSQGFYGGNGTHAGPSSPPPTSPASAADSPPSEGFAVTRPGPARTPVISQPGFAALRPPPGTGRGTPPPIGRGTPPPGPGQGTPPPRSLTPQLRQQDEIGRSHPSFDGSRGSRFSEAV